MNHVQETTRDRDLGRVAAMAKGDREKDALELRIGMAHLGRPLGLCAPEILSEHSQVIPFISEQMLSCLS